MKIDIFGDGKYVYEQDELPDELMTDNGKYIRDKSAFGVSYSLTEPSDTFTLTLKQAEDNKVLKEAENIDSTIQGQIDSLTARVEALESK